MSNKNTLTRVVCGAVVALLPFASLAQTDSAGSTASTQQQKTAADSKTPAKAGLSMADKKFVREAAQGGMAEVELGRLATEKGSTDEVKKFGQRMVDDHTKAGDELKEIASSKGIQAPQQLSAKDKATKVRLSKLSGEQFDKAYMADMVRDHTQDVADFQRESKSGTNNEVKDFASKTLPTLQDHLREAKAIAPSPSKSAHLQR